MSADGPRSITDLLRSDSLGRLGAEARSRRMLAARVREVLPEEQALHVVSAHLDQQDRLVVGMDSSVWAARLRYSGTSLLGYELRVRVVAPGSARSPDR